jgi:hypothetical protein
MSCSWVRDIESEVMARVRIGWSAGLTLAYTGGAGKPVGSRLLAALMACWTSCSAISRLSARLNCKVMTDALAELADVIWVRLGIWPSCTSRGAVTVVAITCGLAPG